MSFGTGWALFGLAALAPLVVLHLRDRHREHRGVPSLILWRELNAPRSVGSRGLRLPQRPLLLLLEALALTLFVLALAQPRVSAATPARAKIVVLDDSLLMSTPGRLATARMAVSQTLSTLPAGRRVDIVLAQGNPRVLYRGGRAGAAASLRNISTSLAPSSLPAALTVAAGLVSGPSDSITVIRAAGDQLPSRIDTARGELRTITIGSASGDQGIFDANSICGIGSSGGCEIEATVRNLGTRALIDRATAEVPGRAPLNFTVSVPADGSSPITLGAVAGEQVTIKLDHADAVAGDNTASVSVPLASGLPAKTIVTLVGQPSRALALAQAFAAVPGVELHLLTPARYRASDARSSGLVVLDDWMPKGALPATPSLLLVDPPRLPGGRVTGTLSDTVLAGVNADSPVLDGVDLSPLAIDRASARAITLPRWIVPLAWSAAGPLLAAGDNGRTRVTVLGFEASRSDLPQLAAFPLLGANIVRWAAGWAPASAAAGEPISVDATAGASSLALAHDGKVLSRAPLTGHPVAVTAPSPGLYTVTETGPSVSRRSVVTVNAVLPEPSSSIVDLRSVRATAHSVPAQLSIWFLLAALLVLMIEWAYWLSTRPRPLWETR